jgi:hypothetical protein
MDTLPMMLSSQRRTLDYALPIATWRRRARRLVRWSCIGLLLATVGLSVALAPKAYRRWQLLRMQEACLKAELPAGRPLHDSALDRMMDTIKAHPGEYHLDGQRGVSRADGRWLRLSKQTDPAWTCAGPASNASATLFLHERSTPSGRRRLVVVEIDGTSRARMCAQVIEPAGWRRPARLIMFKPVYAHGAGVERLMQLVDAGFSIGSGSQYYNGRADPSNPSRFTIPFRCLGVAGELDCRLTDDDYVHITLGEEVVDRVDAALKAGRTQGCGEPPDAARKRAG